MLIVKGDKIKQVKEIMGFNYVGKEFVIDEVNMGVISFSGNIGRGVMSYDELERYFEKVVVEDVPTWSEWKDDDSSYYKYRVKGKLIEYKNHIGNRVIAKCLPEDTFDLEIGLSICRRKMEIEEIKNELNNY